MFLCMLECWNNLETANSNLLSRAIILATHPPLKSGFPPGAQLKQGRPNMREG